MSVDRNLTTPRVWNWTLSLQTRFYPETYVGDGLRRQPRVGN